MLKRLFSCAEIAVLVLATAAGCSGSIDGSGPNTGPIMPGGSGGNSGSGGSSMKVCTPNTSLAPTRIWRLTDQQYVNVVAQVFGVRMPAEVTQADTQPADFTSTSEAPELTVQATTANAYATAAHTAAVGAVTANLNVFLPCGTTSPSDTCVEKFIRNRVARAFGRPVTDAEVQDLLGIYHTGVMTENPAAGVRLIIEATLQAPSFLYRTELGTSASNGKVKLTAHELATAIAFALLDSVPDDQLWSKAEAGSLLTPSVLSAEIDRLLALPAVQANLAAKAGFWLGIEKLRSIVPKDQMLFPEFTADLKQSLYRSAQMFVQDLISHGTMSDLLTSNRVYANANIAKVYGIPGVTSNDLVPVDVSGTDRSAGILTQPAVLAAWAHPNRGDVIHRGLYVYYALVCGAKLPPPPDNATAVASRFPANATEREKAQLRASAPEGCGSCHGLFDPLGLVSERYDAIGRYQATDAMGQSIDSSSMLKNLGPDLDGPVSGMADLVGKLKGGRRVSDCAVQNLSVVVLGRSVVEDTSCELQKVQDRFAASGSFGDYYRAILTAPGFLTRDVAQ
ncbi:MAG TPA: DUF1592 domain-containing protein [Polyangia bacterium]|nr:DUF1592 domain-containing protein [Polyangia bacterium]